MLALRAPLTREDLPGLCARVCAHLERRPAGDVACGVAGLAADAVAVEALARLQLAARRRGQRVLLHGASEDLRALVALMGLADVLVAAPAPRHPGDRPSHPAPAGEDGRSRVRPG